MADATPPWVERVIARIDALHAQDPRSTTDACGNPIARELLRAKRMTSWLERLVDGPSAELRIAVRAQHLCRWELPRSAHPPGRAGYLRWRAEAARRHAARVSTLLAEEGAPPEAIDRVRALVLKRDLRTDPEAQALEDCACLVFLEHEAAEFAAGRNEASVVDILVKTLRKMSPRARALAPGLPLQPEVRAVLERALAASDGSDGAR